MQQTTILDKNSALWRYLPDDLRGLMLDGEYLLADATEKGNGISDYSYIVFPFSKAYEGFLKKFFVDLDLIREDEYYGDDLRIGRVLNPYFIRKRYSVYRKLRGRPGAQDVAEKLWVVWKKGRNLVFHYFPHNFRRLSYDEALEIVKEIVSAMQLAVARCEL